MSLDMGMLSHFVVCTLFLFLNSNSVKQWSSVAPSSTPRGGPVWGWCSASVLVCNRTPRPQGGCLANSLMSEAAFLPYLGDCPAPSLVSWLSLSFQKSFPFLHRGHSDILPVSLSLSFLL